MFLNYSSFSDRRNSCCEITCDNLATLSGVSFQQRNRKCSNCGNKFNEKSSLQIGESNTNPDKSNKAGIWELCYLCKSACSTLRLLNANRFFEFLKQFLVS